MTQNDENDVIYEDIETKTSKKVGDDVVMDDESEAPAAAIKKLKEKIKTLEKEKQENMDGWQRERADFINFKKRTETEKLEVIKYANESLVEELLPTLDSFEMAFANKEAWEKVDKNWRIGVEYIYSQLVKALGEHGLKEMNPVGEKFDPKFHVAETHVEVTDAAQDGVIISVKKKGYMLNDRVIIAPQVVVGEHVIARNEAIQ
jgi:molecular chaperone GrpE